MKKIRNIVVIVCLVLQVMIMFVFGFSQTELPNMVCLLCWCVLGGIIYLSLDSKRAI